MPTHETALRYITMLQHIPSVPGYVTAERLRDILKELDIPVTLRSVQRDLARLADVFKLICDDTQKPHRWSICKGATIFEIPAMNAATALTFRLAQTFLEPLLPPTALTYLDAHFRQAAQVLNHTRRAYRTWPEKIRIIQPGQSLKAPKIRKDVLDAVYAALLEEKQLSVKYRSRSADTLKAYTLNPLAAVFRSGIIYLLATAPARDEVRQFALQRFESAQVTTLSRRVPHGFSVDGYIVDGGFEYLASPTQFSLEALFDPLAAAHLQECRLSEDQVLTEQGDGRTLLKATVKDTAQLRWWLLGFGERVEVLAPSSLRQEFAGITARLADRYRGPA